MKTYDDLIYRALQEDLPCGDVTTDLLIDERAQTNATLLAKEDGVLSGIDVFKRVYQLIDQHVTVKQLKSDGDILTNGDTIAMVEGPTASILKGERIALNFLQRMSGIATVTQQYVQETEGKALIMDTRKTLPTFRELEKQAVRDGGGYNHRMSLSDQILIKDNHIAASGSICNAVTLAKQGSSLIIEVEVETIAMFKEALATECHVIMLDNMSIEQMSECVSLNQGKKLLEASGNMSLERIKEVSKTGVNYISVGALTHSAKALDISLRFIL